MGCKVCSLVWRNGDQPSTLIQYRPFWFSYTIHSEHMCVLPGKEVPVQIHCVLLSGPICNPPGLLAVVWVAGQPCSGPSHQGICHIVIYSLWQSLCHLLAYRTVLAGTLCLRGCKKNVSGFTHLCIAAYPHMHSFHGPRWPSQGSPWGYLLADSYHYPNQSSSDGVDMCLLLLYWVLGPSNGTNEIGPKMYRHK